MLLTHFGGIQEADFLYATLFWSNQKLDSNIRFLLLVFFHFFTVIVLLRLPGPNLVPGVFFIKTVCGQSFLQDDIKVTIENFKISAITLKKHIR